MLGWALHAHAPPMHASNAPPAAATTAPTLRTDIDLPFLVGHLKPVDLQYGRAQLKMG